MRRVIKFLLVDRNAATWLPGVALRIATNITVAVGRFSLIDYPLLL